MEIKNLLPVGSVVSLKDAEKKLMIIGIKQFQEEKNVMKDYIGVMYPEGYINRDLFYIFNHEDIVEILFRGYENQEWEKFLEAVEKTLAETGE